jgi:hypothetical protein
MKNLYKLTLLSLLAVFFIACSDDDRFENTPNSGWVEFNSGVTEAAGLGNLVEIPVDLTTGTNLNGITLTYNAELISGDFPDGQFGSYTTEIPKGETTGNIMFNVGVGSDYTVRFTLVSSDDKEFQIGLPNDDSKLITHTLTVCKNGSIDLLEGVIEARSETDGAAIEASYAPVMTPSADTANSYDTANMWGNAVEILTGGAAPAIPYPGTLTINDDLTVDFVGSEGYTTGGTGVYDACTNEITLSLTQALFTGDFTVEVYLTPGI